MGRHSGRTPKTNPAETITRSCSPVALLIPNATVFVSSFCIMVIELVAGRIIARHLGSSLYTWTSVIGIVLAGLAIGNYVGGRLADRFSVNRTLATLFIASSAASALISVSSNFVGSLNLLWSLPWQWRVASHVALVFFLPSCLLGMISPVVAKMALDVGYKTGRTLGNVYAWGVVGSIIGTFMTGFFLVAWFGTTTIVLCVAAVLALMAILYQVSSWKPWSWSVVLVAFCFLATGSAEAVGSWGEVLLLRESPHDNVLYSYESQYSYIQVIQATKDPDTRHMHLDTLLHSKINLDQPSDMHYDYEKIFAAITARLHPESERIDSLTIGGGGYVFPRYLEAKYAGSRIDVAEIDPAVTEAAMIAFGLPEDTSIHSYHEDGRVLVNRLLKQKRDGLPVGSYDFIFVDAFNDINVPYQLTTLEFARNVGELLKPDGVYLINLIDMFDSGLFLGATVNTLQEVFAHVYVFVEGVPTLLSLGTRNTFVVAATNRPIDATNLGAEYAPDCQIYSLSEQRRSRLAEESRHLILTDDYAPVENLLTYVVRKGASRKSIGDWLGTIQLAATADDHDGAIGIALQALSRFPNNPLLLTELGRGLRSKGQVRKAIARLRAALEQEPSYVRARLGLTDCYRDLDRIEDSLPHFESIIDYHPLIRYNYGGALLHLGRFHEAVEQFNIVSKLRPNFANAYNNCGVALHRLGDRDGAIQQFTLALKHFPEHPDAGPSLVALLASPERDERQSASGQPGSPGG